MFLKERCKSDHDLSRLASPSVLVIKGKLAKVNPACCCFLFNETDPSRSQPLITSEVSPDTAHPLRQSIVFATVWRSTQPFHLAQFREFLFDWTKMLLLLM